MANDNRTLGRFVLDGIPSAPRGVPQIEVTFDIDANGIVNVSAVDKATSKKQHITITASSGLNENEIDKMVKDADAHSQEDKKRREEIELRNQADSMVYNTEKTLKENKEKISPSMAADLESAVAALKKSIEDKNADSIKSNMEKLTSLSHKMAEELYKTAQAKEEAEKKEAEPGEEKEAPSEEKKDEDVVDAEFEEAKDD
jgi:molecular chaperone DnaK